MLNPSRHLHTIERFPQHFQPQHQPQPLLPGGFNPQPPGLFPARNPNPAIIIPGDENEIPYGGPDHPIAFPPLIGDPVLPDNFPGMPRNPYFPTDPYNPSGSLRPHMHNMNDPLAMNSSNSRLRQPGSGNRSSLQDDDNDMMNMGYPSLRNGPNSGLMRPGQQPGNFGPGGRNNRNNDFGDGFGSSGGFGFH